MRMMMQMEICSPSALQAILELSRSIIRMAIVSTRLRGKSRNGMFALKQ